MWADFQKASLEKLLNNLTGNEVFTGINIGPWFENNVLKQLQAEPWQDVPTATALSFVDRTPGQLFLPLIDAADWIAEGAPIVCVGFRRVLADRGVDAVGEVQADPVVDLLDRL